MRKSTAKSKGKKPSNESFEWRELFEGRRKWFSIVPACLLIIGLGWWAYVRLTVMKPVEASQASVEQVVDFITSERGLIQMPIEQRQDYLARTWQTYAQAPPAQQQRVVQQLNRLSSSQQQVFGQAVAGIVKNQVMEGAKHYNNLRTDAERQAFAQDFYGRFQQMRTEITGGGKLAPGMDVAKPLAAVTPKGGEDIQKALVDQSTPGERAKAAPFVDQLVSVHKTEIQKKIDTR